MAIKRSDGNKMTRPILLNKAVNNAINSFTLDTRVHS